MVKYPSEADREKIRKNFQRKSNMKNVYYSIEKCTVRIQYVCCSLYTSYYVFHHSDNLYLVKCAESTCGIRRRPEPLAN